MIAESKINDSSNDLLPDERRLKTFYEEYAKILEKYSSKIQLVKEQLDSLRKERAELLTVKIPEMRKKLEEKGIEKKYIDEWLNQFEHDTTQSIRMSENLLNTYFIAEPKEFRKEIENIYKIKVKKHE